MECESLIEQVECVDLNSGTPVETVPPKKEPKSEFSWKKEKISKKKNGKSIKAEVEMKADDMHKALILSQM